MNKKIILWVCLLLFSIGINAQSSTVSYTSAEYQVREEVYKKLKGTINSVTAQYDTSSKKITWTINVTDPQNGSGKRTNALFNFSNATINSVSINGVTATYDSTNSQAGQYYYANTSDEPLTFVVVTTGTPGTTVTLDSFYESVTSLGNQLIQAPKQTTGTANISGYAGLTGASYTVPTSSCPTTVTTTVTSTAETCSSDGTITVTLSEINNVKVILKKGTEIVAQRSGETLTGKTITFEALEGGNYTVETLCNETLQSYSTKQVNVKDEYTPMTASVSVADVCTNYTAGGTININNVANGKAPYTYSIIKSDNANYDDSQSQYTSDASKTVTEYGLYQVRIKDACGNYITQQVDVQPTLPKTKVFFNAENLCSNIKLNWRDGSVKDADKNATIADASISGMKIIIRHSSATGTEVYNGTMQRSNSIEIPKSSDNKYYITYINACGVEFSETVQYLSTPTRDDIWVANTLNGCGINEKQKIVLEAARVFSFPINITVTNLGNNEVVFTGTMEAFGKTQYVENLTPGKYKVTYVDKCGVTVEKTIENPKDTKASLTTVNVSINNGYCYNDEKYGTGAFTPALVAGSKQIYVSTRGYVPNLANAKLHIISGPSQVGVQGVKFPQDNRWAWTDILPGDYVIRISGIGGEGCTDDTMDLPLTVKGDDVVKRDVKATATSTCSGTGTVTVTNNYNGGVPYVVELLNEKGEVVESNTSGVFTNVAAGTYKTRLKLTDGCKGVYYLDGNEVTIASAQEGPAVKISSILCEPGEQGRAFVRVVGVAPYTIKYKLSTATQWTTINNVTDETTELNGLTKGATYTAEISDKCGKLVKRDFTIEQVGDYLVRNAAQPCVGQSYTLEGDDYPGATYEWYRPNGSLASSSRTYQIPVYNKSHDGTYKLIMKWGDCVTREMDVTIYGGLCNQPVTKTSVSGNVFHDTDGNTSINGQGIGTVPGSGEQLYVTIKVTNEDGSDKQGEVIATVKVNADGSYTIPGIPVGNYRLFLGTDPIDNTPTTLPEGWGNVGENLGTVEGNDGKADGSIFITIGNSQITNANFGINNTLCYKDPVTNGTVLDTKFGITALGRAGDQGDNWPMVRKGAHAVLEANTKGFVLNRVKTSDVQNLVKGMLVYDIDNDCLSLYDGTAWKCLKQPGCPD